MWENINSTWLEMRSIAAEGLARYGISRFCDWVKQRSHLFHGATAGTIMRHDAYRFISLGTRNRCKNSSNASKRSKPANAQRPPVLCASLTIGQLIHRQASNNAV
jgi:hypothetical protein